MAVLRGRQDDLARPRASSRVSREWLATLLCLPMWDELTRIGLFNRRLGIRILVERVLLGRIGRFLCGFIVYLFVFGQFSFRRRYFNVGTFRAFTLGGRILCLYFRCFQVRELRRVIVHPAVESLRCVYVFYLNHRRRSEGVDNLLPFACLPTANGPVFGQRRCVQSGRVKCLVNDGPSPFLAVDHFGCHMFYRGRETGVLASVCVVFGGRRYFLYSQGSFFQFFLCE